MNKTEVAEIVMKIIGEVFPQGKTEVDEERHNNIEVLGEVFRKLFEELTDIITYKKDAYEHSIVRIRKKAESIIEDVCSNWFYDYYLEYFKKHKDRLEE